MKEQEKTPERKLNEMEASRLPDTEFKTMVIRILRELSETFNSIKKDIQTIKMNQSEMKDIQTEMKYNLQGINSRAD